MGLLGLLIDVGTEVVSNIKEKKAAKTAAQQQAQIAKAQANTVNAVPQAPAFTIPAQTQTKLQRAMNRPAGNSGGTGGGKFPVWGWVGIAIGGLLALFLIFKKK